MLKILKISGGLQKEVEPTGIIMVQQIYQQGNTNRDVYQISDIFIFNLPSKLPSVHKAVDEPFVWWKESEAPG